MSSRPSVLRYFTDHPTAANLLMALFIFLGLSLGGDLRRETFPDFSAWLVEIVVPYPGANAEKVEEAICQRIETALEKVNDILEVRSEALENRARVIVEMREEGDIQRFINEIKTEVESIDDFPEQTEKPVIRELGRTDNVVSIAISGSMSVPDLKQFCEQFKDRLMLAADVSQVDILGFSEHQFRVSVPAAKLMQFGLSVADITQSISRQNVDMPAGLLETSDQDIHLRFADERHTIQEYEDLIIVSQESGEEVRLGDLAHIEDRFELDEEKFLFNGQRAGLLVVKKLKSEDSLRMMDRVAAFVEAEQQAAPPGVHFTFTRNMTDIVSDRLQMLLKNGIAGLVLVFLTLWLFFSIRLAFWVTMGLPVSFLGTFWIMQSVNFSINMLTMVGLLMALGLIMDDAIVIAENVVTQLRNKKKPLDAAVDGTRQVARGVLSSFATTVLVFGAIPIFLEGEMGKVLWVMPVVLIMTLCVSLVEAFLILPNHLAHSLKFFKEEPTTGFRYRFEQILEGIREKGVGRVVDMAIRWRWAFTGMLVFIFLFSLGWVAGGKIKFIGFPEIDGDVLEARILAPQGTPIAQTEKIVKEVLEALERVNRQLTPQQRQGQDLVINVSVQFNQNADAHEAGAHVATVTVDLLKAETRVGTLDEISRRWRKELGVLPDVIGITFKEPVIGPGGLPIEIRLKGEDLGQLKAASLELQRWLNRYDGVVDLHDDLRPGKPEIQIKLKPGTLAKGLDAMTIASQLRNAFYGDTASEVQVGSESYEVDVQFAQMDQNGFDDLDNFYVTGKDGSLYPLGEIAILESARGPARIFRVDGQRTVSVEGDVDSAIANSAEIMNETARDFLPKLIGKYPGLSYSLEGMQKESGTTGQSMGKAFMVAIFSVFFLLSFQLKSYVEALIVMSAIPFALIGVVWGHEIMGLSLSMVSAMGFISLAGVVINDSILLVEFIRLNTEKGKPVFEAAPLASRQRFRAVLLTSLTTIAGLVPLLAEKSLQAQVLVPLVTSVVFGLLASTLLVLVVVPVLYSILADFGRAPGGKKIQPPAVEETPAEVS